MLLDMSHARISAHNMGWKDPKEYFKALPLEKVREIHVAHPVDRGDQMVDMHQPAQAEDFEWLAWALGSHSASPFLSLSSHKNTSYHSWCCHPVSIPP